MPQNDQAVGLSINLPQHVYDVLSTWASCDLGATPEDVLEAMAEALCMSEDLRTYANWLMAE